MTDKHTDESMKLMADLLTTLMPKGWGFTLFTFETGIAPAKVLYISNAEREDMIGTIQTILDKWNRGEDFINPNLN